MHKDLRSTTYNTINGGAGAAVVAGGGLAYTGVESIWLALAGVTLIAAGTAVYRLVPRLER